MALAELNQEDFSMKIIKDLGMLYPTNESKRMHHYGLFECSKCLVPFKSFISSAKKNKQKFCMSCAQKTHGYKNHKLYSTWIAEKARCININHRDYINYGTRGITFANEFLDMSIWLEYVESLPDYNVNGYTLDRIDNDGNYERGNLRWTSRNTQSSNTRRLYSHNTSGFRGVSITENKQKWRARICINKKEILLGRYKTKLEAAIIYDTYVIKNNLEHTLNNVLSEGEIMKIIKSATSRK